MAEESNPPRTVMQCFVWGIYVMCITIILLAVDEVGVFTGGRVLTWSIWRWITLVAVIIVVGIGIGLALQYWVDNWCIRWAASIKKKAAKKEYKRSVKEKVGKEMKDYVPP